MKFIKLKNKSVLISFNLKYLHTYGEHKEGCSFVYYNDGDEYRFAILKIDLADFEKKLTDFIQDEKAVILDLNDYEYERN